MTASTLSFLQARDFRAAQALHPDLELCPPTTGRSEDGAAPEELLFADFVCLEHFPQLHLLYVFIENHVTDPPVMIGLTQDDADASTGC
jgi:hypothetical protein